MDNWVPDTSPLWDARITSHGINKMATVREFVGEDGNWNCGVLSSWLSHLVLLRISGIVGTGWTMVASQSRTPRLGYPKECGTLTILTNLERCRRWITSDPSCELCGSVQESSLHTVRDGPSAAMVWKGILPGSDQQKFFTSDLTYWLFVNLKNTESYGDYNVQWNTLFAIICWNFWKQRNGFIFQNMNCSSDEIIGQSLSWAQHFRDSCLVQGLRSNRIFTQAGWKPPPLGWVKINTDGSTNY